jgi:hypothetical protein
MARPRKQAPVEEQESTRHNVHAVIAVLILLVAAAALAVEALWTGSLFVKVDTNAQGARDACLVCVYEGAVQDELTDDARSGIVQLQPLAAVKVAPGTEVPIPGRWKGTYTLAVIDPSGALDTRACVLEINVGKNEMHVAFMLAGNTAASEDGTTAGAEQAAGS